MPLFGKTQSMASQTAGYPTLNPLQSGLAAFLGHLSGNRNINQDLIMQDQLRKQEYAKQQQQQAIANLVTPPQGLSGQAFGQENSAMAQNLLKAGLTEQALKIGNPLLAQRLQGPQAPIAVAPNAALIDPVTQKEVFRNTVAETPKTSGKFQEFLDLANGDPTKARQMMLADYQRTQSGTGKDAFRIMTPAEVAAQGLPDGFTYQLNSSTGQISKLTEPKQDKPTQGENTAAYQGRRLSSALGTLGKTLAEDKSAITTGVPDMFGAEKLFRSDASQRVQSLLPEIGDALLTLGTGAAYTQEQFKNMWTANLPSFGDPDVVKADKLSRIEALYDQAKKNAGSAGVDLPSFDSIAKLYAPTEKKKPMIAAVGGAVQQQNTRPDGWKEISPGIRIRQVQ